MPNNPKLIQKERATIIKTPSILHPDGRVEVLAQVKNGKMRGRSVTVLLDTDEIVKDQVNGFVTFLREKAIVGLAVGFVVGSQSQAVVRQLNESFIDPAFQLFFGGVKLSERTFVLNLWQNSAEFGWGGMAYALLNLIFVLLIIYTLIKVFHLDKLDVPKKSAVEEAPKKPAPKRSKLKKSV